MRQELNVLIAGFRTLRASFENLVGGGEILPSELRKYYNTSSSFRHGLPEPRVDMDVSGSIREAWTPAIHAGMTETADGQTPSNNGVGDGRDVRPFPCLWRA